jgi:hypothetical protein
MWAAMCRASSCPALGTECTWDHFNTPNPNTHTLFGALVGGPGAADHYVDARNDYIKNEVATDYNAGFSGGCYMMSCNMLYYVAALNVLPR